MQVVLDTSVPAVRVGDRAPESITAIQSKVLRSVMARPGMRTPAALIATAYDETEQAVRTSAFHLDRKLKMLLGHDSPFVVPVPGVYVWRETNKGSFEGLPEPTSADVPRMVNPADPFGGLPEPDAMAVRRGLSALGSPLEDLVQSVPARPAPWPLAARSVKQKRRRSGKASGWPLSVRARRRWRKNGWTPVNHVRPVIRSRVDPEPYRELARRFG